MPPWYGNGPGTFGVPGPFYGYGGRVGAGRGRAMDFVWLGFEGLMGLLKIVLMALAAFGLVDAAFRRGDAFRAADKQNKVFWLVILGLALVVSYFFSFLSFLPIIGVIASIVYIVDVRPALRQVSGGGARWPRRIEQRRSVRAVQRRSVTATAPHRTAHMRPHRTHASRPRAGLRADD